MTLLVLSGEPSAIRWDARVVQAQPDEDSVLLPTAAEQESAALSGEVQFTEQDGSTLLGTLTFLPEGKDLKLIEVTAMLEGGAPPGYEPPPGTVIRPWLSRIPPEDEVERFAEAEGFTVPGGDMGKVFFRSAPFPADRGGRVWPREPAAHAAGGDSGGGQPEQPC